VEVRSNPKSASPRVVGVHQRNTDVDTIISLLDYVNGFTLFIHCARRIF